MFVFLGRWVKQKGMDYIADVADWMLSTYSKAQREGHFLTLEAEEIRLAQVQFPCLLVFVFLSFFGV